MAEPLTATGRQPITVWRCGTCGMVNDEPWFSGWHADRRSAGLNDRCNGSAFGPYYLISQGMYLDMLLVRHDD